MDDSQDERAARKSSGPADEPNRSSGPPADGKGDESAYSRELTDQESAPSTRRGRPIHIMPSQGERTTAGEPTTVERVPTPDRPTERAGGPGFGPVPEHRVAPDLRHQEVLKGTHPGDRFIRYGRNVGPFRRRGGGILAASLAAEAPRGAWGRGFNRVKRVLFGRPLSTEQSIHERLTVPKALAVLSSDPLSSVAYATEEILRVLILAGLATVSTLTMPVGLAVMTLLAIVAISYRQTIAAYPRGGGSYIVAKDNLGPIFGLTAASSLLIDYTMTVAVSVTSGIAAIYSLFPMDLYERLQPYRVDVCVVVVVLVTIANLRGVRESGNIFALPTYLFVVGILGMIAYGFLRLYLGVNGTPQYVPPPQVLHPGSEQLIGFAGIFLVLRAFTQGCTALTGVEAISDGVPAFKPPEAKSARATLGLMAVLAITMFGGITFLATQLHILPSDQETVLSQLARTVLPPILGGNPLWFYINIATALILVLAANTAFSDFPRLSYFLARDKYMPHQYSFRGDRLAFSWGIVTLALLACVLIISFHGDTSALIPLYTVGVFNSFTLSQAGMVRRWWRTRTPGWQRSMAVNALGATTTGLVLIISAVTKFVYGAWIVIVLIPILIFMFLAINRHYRRVEREVEAIPPLEPRDYKHTFVVPIASLNPVTLSALSYARSLSNNVTAVHLAVGEDPTEAEKFNAEWRKVVGNDVPLVIIESPYRSLIGPLLHYIDALDEQVPDDTITIVLPEVLPARWWEYLLHNQSALRLKGALLFRPHTVVADVPYHLPSERAPINAQAQFPWLPLLALVVVMLLIYYFVLGR